MLLPCVSFFFGSSLDLKEEVILIMPSGGEEENKTRKEFHEFNFVGCFILAFFWGADILFHLSFVELSHVYAASPRCDTWISRIILLKTIC